MKIDVEIVRGAPGSALVDESRHAAMICVGSIGISRVARKVLGSTADEIAQTAHCPAAIIRTRHEPAVPGGNWIAVVVDDSPGNDAVLEHGFREARLRGSSILALGCWRWGLGEIPYQQLNQRLKRWVAQYPDVHVQPAAARRGAAEFLTGTDEFIQLAVVGNEKAGEVARMVGPVIHHLPRRAGCSVLVVRA